MYGIQGGNNLSDKGPCVVGCNYNDYIFTFVFLVDKGPCVVGLFSFGWAWAIPPPYVMYIQPLTQIWFLVLGSSLLMYEADPVRLVYIYLRGDNQ